MPKIKIDSSLYDKAKQVAAAAGYAGVEEFIAHLINQEFEKIDTGAVDENVADRLRGLGYIE